MLMPLLRLMLDRATDWFKWAKIELIIYVRLHREPVLTEGRRLSLSVCPTHSGDPHPQVDINKNSKDGVFYTSFISLDVIESIKYVFRCVSVVCENCRDFVCGISHSHVASSRGECAFVPVRSAVLYGKFSFVACVAVV